MPSRRTEEKVKGQKNLRREKDQKDPPRGVNRRASQKVKKRPSQGKGQWTTWSWSQKEGVSQNQDWSQGAQEGHNGKPEKGKIIARYVVSQVILLSTAGGVSLEVLKVRVKDVSEFPQDQAVQTLQPDQLRGLQGLRPVTQQQQQPYLQSQVSSNYGSQFLLFFFTLAR